MLPAAAASPGNLGFAAVALLLAAVATYGVVSLPPGVTPG
jgi:hypothetical protein